MKSAPASPPPTVHLSPRESAVGRLVCAFLTNKEIGLALGIAENTVACYCKSLFAKLGARNRTEAAFKYSDLQRERSTRNG